MKIFQVVPYYPPHIGGMEFYVQRLSEELAARGHDVTVFTTTSTAEQSVTRVNGVRVIALKMMTKVYNVPIVPSLFWRLLSEGKPDVVHTHQYPVFFSDTSAAASCLNDTPLIVHVHVVSDAKSSFSGFISNIYYSTVGLRTLNAADRIFVPSLAYKNKLAGMRVNHSQIQVIPYGINTKKFGNADGTKFRKTYDCEDSPIILSVGRLNYQKGFQYLIRAMPAILKIIPGAKLLIVGEGEQLEFLKRLSKSMGIRESVIFTGALNQTEIPAAYNACDVFVLASIFESFGISLIEAQAAGKPVIATRSGGAPEALVDGETGFLVESANPKQLEDAIVRVLLNPALSESMGMRGKEFVEKFDNQRVIDEMVGAYKRLLNC